MEKPAHVIAIDDNPDDRRLVERELRLALPAVRVTQVADAAQLERVLRGEPFDLVVTDFELRWTDGIAVLRAVKARHPTVPVIMFTGSGNEEVAVEAMKGGLDDYVVKSPRQLIRLRISALNCLKSSAAARRATLVEVRQQTLLNRLSVGVFRMTLEGRLLECNPAFLKLVGVGSLDEARSLDLAPFRLPDADRQRMLALPKDNGHNVQWEARVVTAAGEPRWVAVNATLSTLGEQAVADYVIDDVTARHRITERLAAANAAKDQFIARLSHELRTPLTPVLGIATMLEGAEGLPAEVRADMATIRRNVELEARLVDDLLDFSRLSRGELQLHFEVVDAHEVVRGAWDTCRRGTGGTGETGERLAATFSMDAPRRRVWADRGRLHQVFFNLFLNAVRFTPAGGAIEVASSNPSPGELRIDVRDTGVGIGPEDLARLFDPFEQVRPPNRPAQGGLGLGLTISRKLAELHGGTLTARSEGAGRGTTFTVTLPIRPEAAGGEGGAAPSRSAPEPRDSGKRRPRVLLVEDNPDTLAVMTRILRLLGYDVATAASVRQAREAADPRAFDVLVSDIGLPDGTGYDLLRELSGSGPVVAIALSGYGTDADRRQSREAGFLEHLVKPVDVERLRVALARASGAAER